MKQLIVLPTWIIHRLIIMPILPKTHVWYGKNFGLKDWAEYGTWLLYYFSIMFWISAIALLLATIY